MPYRRREIYYAFRLGYDPEPGWFIDVEDLLVELEGL